MSRGPTPKGVAAVRNLVLETDTLRIEAKALQARIATLNAELKTVNEAIARTLADRKQWMHEMDIGGPGNNGYESRIEEFINEMARQTGPFAGLIALGGTA